MSNPMDDLPDDARQLWAQLGPMISEALNDGHVLPDTPEVRRRLSEADDLARKMEEDT